MSFSFAILIEQGCSSFSADQNPMPIQLYQKEAMSLAENSVLLLNDPNLSVKPLVMCMQEWDNELKKEWIGFLWDSIRVCQNWFTF